MKFDYSRFPIIQGEGESKEEYLVRLERAFDELNGIDGDRRIIGLLNVIANSAQQLLQVITGQAQANTTPVDPFAALYLHFEQLQQVHPVAAERIDEVRPMSVNSYFPNEATVADAQKAADSMGMAFEKIPAAIIDGEQRYVLRVKSHRLTNPQPGQVSKLAVGQPLPWMAENPTSKQYQEKDWNPLWEEPEVEEAVAANDSEPAGEVDVEAHGEQPFGGSEGDQVSITSASLEAAETEEEADELPEVAQTVDTDLTSQDFVDAVERRQNLSLVFDASDVFQGKISVLWKNVVVDLNGQIVLMAAGPGCVTVLRTQDDQVVMDIYGRLNAAIYCMILDEAKQGPVVVQQPDPLRFGEQPNAPVVEETRENMFQ